VRAHPTWFAPASLPDDEIHSLFREAMAETVTPHEPAFQPPPPIPEEKRVQVAEAFRYEGVLYPAGRVLDGDEQVVKDYPHLFRRPAGRL
jgi:hypothetical protein